LILADTSAWIEYLRATGSATDHRLAGVVGTKALAATDVVVMEVLAGARHREPGWEFTSLKGLDLDAYAPVVGGDLGLVEGTPLVVRPPDQSVALTQVDAAFAPSPEVASEGPLVMSLSAAVESHPELVEAHLGSVVDAEDPFVARNEANWLGGAFVYVPRNMKVQTPISLRAIQAAAGGAMHWRVLGNLSAVLPQ
jgi:hypothetical protein